MDRWLLAARTMAKPMRCVNETFLGLRAAFSLERRASSAATSTSRNEVAVGTPRLAVMFATSRAAGPFRGVAPAGTSLGLEGAAGCPFAWGPPAPIGIG